ncbi:MAG TPA: hypothetical protein VLW53_02860 [Candidatus Eisenbacteria bacterium]|nr:hypothetical protein [Candidatus Eisenbacteria bacterium]
MRTPRALVPVAVVSGLLMLSPPALPVTAGFVRPATAADERSALRAAEASGAPVEALSDRTEYAQVFANPDGTFQYRAAPVPQRVKRPDGTWADVDSTLRRQADGSIAPAASPAGLVLSGGDSGPLFTVSRAGGRLAFTWPLGPLPAPVLSGSSATYRQVLPGVDLRLAATPTGVSEVLVVRDAQAAANPALARITFGLAASGLTVSVDAAGALSATDPSGTVVFEAQPPRAWDSAGGDAGPGEPGPGSHRAALGVQLGAGSLTLSPPPGMLTGPDTVYPLYIDPQVTVHGPQSGWLDVGRDNSGGSWGDWEPSDARMGAWCSPDSSGSCLNSYRGEYRSYFNFPVPSKIWDSDQISSRLYTNETWSWTCSVPKYVELWQTSWAASGDTWSSRPTENQWQDNAYVAYGNTCPAHGVSFDASGAARAASSGHWSHVTLELRAYADDETNWNVYSWKRFSVDQTSDPYLVINYDHAPDTPTDLAALDGSRSIGCPSTADTWISNTAPWLQAKITDPDAAVGDQVRAEFQYAHLSTGTPSGTLTSAYADSGTVFEEQIPAGKLTDGGYWWNAWGYDGTLDGAHSSPTCKFSVDTSRPAPAGIVSTTYHSGVAENPIGTVGMFTFSDPDNVDPYDQVNDVAGYRYGFTNPPTNYVVADTSTPDRSASVWISPVWLGGRTLYVQAVDRAGNLSPDDSPSQGQFDVETIRSASDPTPLLAWWKLAEGGGTTAADATGNGHTARLAAQAGWGPGRLTGTSALSVTGASDSEAATPSGLPAVDNTGSFTVSAWLKLSPACASSPSTCVNWYAAVSQDGTVDHTFALQYVPQSGCAAGAGDGVSGCWSFSVPSSDSSSPPVYRVEASTPVVFGGWVHLVGVFDQPHQTIDMFVNGQEAAVSGPLGGVQPWPGTAMGPLRMGRELLNSGPAEWWPGEISDVCTFWGTLDAAQIQNVYTSGCGAAGAP